MNTGKIKQMLEVNAALKRHIHRMLINPRKTTPRLWVRLFVNPFFNVRGRGAAVRRSARLNVTPINRFALGARSRIEGRCTVDNAVGDVVIGSDTRIGIGNTLIGPVTVGNKVITAQNVVLSGLNHNYLDPQTPIRDQGVTTGAITISDDVWIGANSVIAAGVSIGRHTVVAAGSVVTHSIPGNCVCAGVPAHVIKYYDPAEGIWKPAAEFKQ